MIIWLASYPKSGNTWVRAFITSLFYESSGDNHLEHMTQIRSYPLSQDFYNLLDDFNDLKKIAANWESSQSILNLQKKIKIIKTHHVLCKINGYPFTGYKNSIGAIYIVRDPRNVITSIKHHYSIENYNEALKFILDKDRFTGKLGRKESYQRETQFPTYISNWKNHYNSWHSFKKNFLLIKYEDLINSPKKTFNEISKYLSKVLNVKINDNKINEAIEKSSFKNLQKSEEKFGFLEAPFGGVTDKKKFFNLGPKNNWREFLPTDIKNEIEKKFEKEMIELGYL